MKKILSIISIAFLTIFISPSTANAGMSVGQMVGSGIIEPPQAPSLEPRTGPIGRDGSYGIVDSNGSVTNIVVCGVYCANGTFGPGGDLAIIQIPNSNSGIWFGPGTTTYDKESNTFTAVNPTLEEIETTDGDSSTKIFGKRTLTFVSGNVFIDSNKTPQRVIESWTEDSLAEISVTNNNTTEYLNLSDRKTNQEIRTLIQDSNLLLLNDRVQTLINLLGTWIK